MIISWHTALNGNMAVIDNVFHDFQDSDNVIKDRL
jgi:hypothetical protein